MLRNLGAKAGRRLRSAHKPLVRQARRREREGEVRDLWREVGRVEAAIARVAASPGVIVAGPWLAEVGYEVLYWVPFLRWFCGTHKIPPERLVVVSRGGMEPLYRGLAGRYVDLFDLTTPRQLALRNAARREAHEGGGQKQSGASALDAELVDAARARAGVGGSAVLHPSVMFRLFRDVWHGNLPFDLLWRHSVYTRIDGPFEPVPSELPADFIAAKLYSGPALSSGDATRESVRALVAQAASQAPVVLLDAEVAIDEHHDLDLAGIPGVVSARPLMTPRTNLGVQMSLIARSRYFLGTCGGLAWLAPFLGTPTVAVYDDDGLLAPHLFVARHAGRTASAAPFSPLDLNALRMSGLSNAHCR